MNFRDISTGSSPKTYLWDFGEGTTSTEQNPAHLYQNPGTYTVSLKATNTFGSDTNVKQDLINVGKSGVIDFTADKTTIGVGRYVIFTDLSTTTPVHWIWEFGDGSVGTSSYQDHVYQKAGVYTVTLTTSNRSEQNKLTKKPSQSRTFRKLTSPIPPNAGQLL